MKRFIALFLSLVVMLTLVACGAQTEAPAPAATEAPKAEAAAPAEAGKVEVTMIAAEYGGETAAWWADFVAKFNAANEGINLTVDVVSWNDIYSVVTTRISTGEQPDILNISGFADYVADDLLMPATEYTSAAVQAQIIPSFWNSNEMDGTIWALPILASCRALFYNVDLLNEAGVVAPPATWEEVVAVCQAIRAKHGAAVTPWALDISTDEGQAAFSYYSWNFGGGYVDAAGNWNLNSAENVAAVEYIKSLIDGGYVNAGPYTDTRYALQDSFSAGNVAMMIGPMNMVAADSTVNYGVADIPGNGIGLGVCDQLMVFKDKKAADQATRTAAISKFFDAFYD